MSEFKFVVARPWEEEYPGTPGLCIYTYGTQVQTGSEEDAAQFLEYVQYRKPGFNWAIYKVTFEKVSINTTAA